MKTDCLRKSLWSSQMPMFDSTDWSQLTPEMTASSGQNTVPFPLEQTMVEAAQFLRMKVCP